MDDKQFEDRLGLLKKSYERVPSDFNPEDVLQKLDQVPIHKSESEPRKTKRDAMIQKASVWFVSLASVFLLGIITATFLMNEKEETLSGEITDEYIAQLKEDYQAEREKRRVMLKMEEERFSELGFISLADQMIALRTSDREREFYNQNNNPDLLKRDYEEILDLLKLPSEMVEELRKTPLRDDENLSIEFLSEYREKIQSLQSAYDDILADYPEALEMNKAEGKYNETLIMIASKGEPEEFQNMVESMLSQNLRVKVDEGIGQVSVELNNEDVQLIDSLHQDTQYFYRMMFQEPYMAAGTLRYSLDESVQHVKDMQWTLLNVEADQNLYPIMENYFYSLFNEIMKGSSQTSVFDSNGVVKKEYQEAWLSLSSSSVMDPTYYLLKPIAEEMKASGWKKSPSYDLLTVDDLKTALVLAKDGKLDQYTNDVLFEDQTVDLSSSAYWDRIVNIYENFKESGYDLQTIRGLHPVDALGLLEYGNKMEDPLVIYHLMDRTEMGPEPDGYKEEFVANWTRRNQLFSEVDELQFNKESLYGSGDRIYHGVVSGLKNGETLLSFTMLYTEEEIWNLHLNYWLEDPSVHNEEEKEIDDDFMQRVHALYKNFAGTHDEQVLRNAKPTEIVGLYFYTGELKDYDTQYALLVQEDLKLRSREQYVEYMKQYDDEEFKFRELFKSISFQADELFDAELYTGGVATLYVDQLRHPDEEKTKGFQLMNTHAGWRVKYMPMQMNRD